MHMRPLGQATVFERRAEGTRLDSAIECFSSFFLALRLDAVRGAHLNSSVMSALRVSSKMSPAAPHLNAIQLVSIMREAG